MELRPELSAAAKAQDQLVEELNELRELSAEDYADFRLDTIAQFLATEAQALDGPGLVRLLHALHVAQHLPSDEWLERVNELVLAPGRASEEEDLPNWLLGLAAFLPPALSSRLLGQKLAQDYAGSKDIGQLEAVCREHLTEIDQLDASPGAKDQLRHTVYCLFADACARNGVRIMPLTKLCRALFTPEVATSILAHFRIASPARATNPSKSQVLDRPAPPNFAASTAPVSASLPVPTFAGAPPHSTAPTPASASTQPTQPDPVAPISPRASSQPAPLNRDAPFPLRSSGGVPWQASTPPHVPPPIRINDPMLTRGPPIVPSNAGPQPGQDSRAASDHRQPSASSPSASVQQPPARVLATPTPGAASYASVTRREVKERDAGDILRPERANAAPSVSSTATAIPITGPRMVSQNKPQAPLSSDQVRHEFYVLAPFEPSGEDKNFSVLLSGDHPETGCWKPEAAIPLERGHSPYVYHCSLVAYRNEPIQYKYIILEPNGNAIWEKKSGNRFTTYNTFVHFDAIDGLESSGLVDSALRMFHISRDRRLVEVDQQIEFLLALIHWLPEPHEPETYHGLFLRGRELLRWGRALSPQRVTDLVRQLSPLLTGAAPTRIAFIHSILLALVMEARPGYQDAVPEELLSLLPSACATVCSTPHFYHKEDLESFFRNLCNWIDHLHKDLRDVQWLVYVPLLNLLASTLVRQPHYLVHLNSLSSLSHYRRSTTDPRFEKLLLQLRRVWIFHARVPSPFLKLTTILLRIAGSLQSLHNLAAFLIKQSDGSKWEASFKTELVTAILEYLQPESLELAQQIPLLQDDGSSVPAGTDVEFLQRLHTKLYQLISESSSIEVSTRLLDAIPSNLLTLALLERMLSAGSAARLPEVVALIEPFNRCEDLKIELQSDAVFDRIARALHQSRDSPTSEVVQAIDRLLRLRIFQPSRVLELAKSFLHGFPPQKALEWLCSKRAPQTFDPDLELALDKMAKEVLVPQLLEAVGVRPALKHMRKIITSPSCNAPLALDVLQLLCDRGLPPLTTVEAALAQGRLWRKFTQVIDIATRTHAQTAADLLKKQLALVTKLRTSITALCASLASREIVFSLLVQVNSHRKLFLNLCKVLGLHASADLDACVAISTDCTRKLATLNVLLSRYCQAFDLQGSLADLGKAVQELQDAHEDMPLRNVDEQLRRHWAPEMEQSLHVLHELRANELFLGLWNQTALTISDQPSADKPPAPAPVAAEQPAEGEVDTIAWNWDLDDDDDDEESNDEGEAEAVAPEAAPDATATTALPPAQLSFTSFRELSETLIDGVISRCLSLGSDIAGGKITIAQLRDLLSGSDLSTLVDDLTQILAAVQEPAAAASASPEQLSAALAPLQHGLLIHQFVSSFLDFVAILEWGLEDEAASLVGWTKTVDHCLRVGHLAELNAHLQAEPVNKLLARLSFNHPAAQAPAIRVLGNFFAVVAQGADFISQLHAFKDKSELRAVLDLCKSNTDKESELQALANFRDAANVIHAFDDTPAPDENNTLRWNKFLDALNHLQISPVTIRLITDVNAQMVELRRVFTDAYKGSSTRAIADLYNLMEHGFFCFVPPSKAHTMHAKLVAPQCLFAVIASAATPKQTPEGGSAPVVESQRSLEWLEELRNRLMLATDMGSKDLAAIESFLDMLVLVKEINESRVELYISGHPEFQDYSVRLRVDESDLVQLARQKEDLERCLEQWTATVDELRQQHYYLNFFTIHQLLALLPLLGQLREGGENTSLPPQLLDYLKFVKLDIDSEATRSAFSAFYAARPLAEEEGEMPVAQQLTVLGEALNFVFKGSSECHRPWSTAVKANAGDFTPGEPNVIVAAKRNVVLVQLMSLYAQLCQRLPEAEEVLICTASTTREHIRLLLLRCLGAESAGRHSRLYCLTHIEQLSFELQSYATLLHARLCAARQQRTDNAPARYRFAVISGEAGGQEAVTAWANFVRTRLDVVPTVDIRAALEHYFQSRVMQVHSFASEFAGMGKTHIIDGWCRQMAQAAPHRVSIHGQMSSQELAGLLAAQADRPVFHFDLAPNVGSELNTLLFELLVLGAVQGTHGRMLYWPRNSTLAVEVPNSIANSTRLRLHFLDLLPATVLNEAANPIITAGDPHPDQHAAVVTGYHVEGKQVYQNRVQYVCKFLQTYSANKLAAANLAPHLVPDLSAEECMQLLAKHCPNWSNLTLVLRMNFINYFFQQLRAFEESVFFSVELMEAPARVLRQAVVQWLIDTTADFASSSMDPKQSTTYDLSETFKLTHRWGDRRQPYLIFNSKGGGSVSPLWMEPEKAANPEHVSLLRSLSCPTCNRNHARSEHNCTVPRLVEFSEQLGRYLLSVLFGVPEKQIEEAGRGNEGRSDYVLTLDNFLKIVAIHFRVKARIPVVIMGETGCGKTRLIEFVCACQAVPLKKRDVHGGVSLADLYGDVEEAITTAKDFPDLPVYLSQANLRKCALVRFFDEFNTKDAPGFFKSIVCDRRVKEENLPANLVVIAACNPYRKSVSTSTAGLVYQYADAAASQEELKQLAYMVHPLPEIMKQYVWDFGSLTSQAEEQYIERLLARCSVKQFPQAYRGFCRAVHNSHEFVKENEKELHGMVSLRDVLRCCSLYEWFMEYLRENRNAPHSDVTSARAITLTLAICYYFRLTKTLRTKYVNKLGSAFNKDGRFASVLLDESTWILDSMELPPGTAKNQALRENVFVLLVCIYNKIPVFLVGKPGSSKTLAMTLIRNNFGQRRKLTLPSIDITSHQCSPQSTSEGIRESYQRACRLSDAEGRVCGVLLLEEVGLAELSPHLPLKVLHSILDEARVSVVGISNWALDPAKMNRAVHLDRPSPTVKDLETTMKQMLEAQGDSLLVRNLLKPLAEAYNEIYHSHQRVKPDFYGLRDFYALVRDLHLGLQNHQPLKPQNWRERKSVFNVEFEVLRRAVSHNFNGQGADEFAKLLKIFLDKTRIVAADDKKQAPSPLKVVKDNLAANGRVRHLMLLTKNDAALQILLDFNIVHHERTKILFGSDYANDQNDTYVCRMIQQIRMSMERGDCLILLHQDNLYESLYDLLNQNYMHVGNCKYCWIALGAHSRQCVVHEEFKCIVIVDKDRALQPTGLPPPFLNRFVKLMLSPSDIINRFKAADVVDKLTKWMAACASPSAIDQAFVGYHEGFVQSLVVAVIGHLKQRAGARSKEGKIKADLVLTEAKEWALLTATLETGMRLADNRPELPEAQTFFEIYRQQPHLNLAQLCAYAREHEWDSDGGGLQLVVLTHSTRLHQLERAVGEENAPRVKLVHLMNLASEHELSSILADFWSTSDLAANKHDQPERHVGKARGDDDHAAGERYLLVTAHAPGCSDDRLSHFKFLCSRERARFVQTQHGRPPRHVVVLRFLPRLQAAVAGRQQPRPAAATTATSTTERSQGLAKIDIERHFRHVYLDNVLSGSETGEPEVEQMLNRSMSDILRQETIARSILPDLIRREYRRVLNRLQFSSALGSDDGTRLHAALIKMMERVLQRKEFVDGLAQQLVYATRATEGDDDNAGAVAWQTKLVRDNASSREGSLRAAFYQHFVTSTTRQLSWLLAHVGANANIQLLDSTMQQQHDHPLAKLWLRLLAMPGLWSFEAVAGAGGMAKAATGGPVVEVQHQIKATFPFSSAVVAAVDLLRHDAEATAQARESELHDPLLATEESLQQLLANGKLREVAELDEQLAERYLADFVELQVRGSGSIAHEDDHMLATAKRLLESLLRAAIQQAGLTVQVSSVHAAYWAVEGFASELFIAFNVLGRQAGLADSLARIEPADDHPLPLLHQQLAIIRSLLASLQLPGDDVIAADDDQVVRAWASRCVDLRSGIRSLLSLLATPGDVVLPTDEHDSGGQEQQAAAAAAEEEEEEADEEVARAREELRDVLAAVEHQWQLVQLLVDFYQIVVVSLEMPTGAVVAFNRLLHDRLPTAESLAAHDAIKLVIEFLRKELVVTNDAQRHWQQLSRFAEEFVLSAFLPAVLTHTADQGLALELLGRAIVGKSDIFAATPGEEAPATADAGGVVLTSSAKCAIISRLLAGYDSIREWNASGARRVLAAQLASTHDEATADDQPLAVLYLECFEDWLEAAAGAHRAHKLKEETASATAWLQGESLIDRLHTVGLVRVVVHRLADELHGIVLEADAQLDPARQQQRQHVVEAANDLIPAVTQLSTGPGKLPLGQPVLHLVRVLAQRSGLQLAKAILCSTRAQDLLPWVRDLDVARLLIVGRDGGRSDRVPSVDAFELLPLEDYVDWRDTLRATLQVGEAGGLKQKLTTTPLPYSLFPALYQEVAVMHAEGNTQNAAKGLEWLARFVDQQYPTTLGTNRKEWAKLASCYVSDNWALERWLITRETSYGTMATFSLLSHLAAVVGRLGERASPLHQLLFAPQSQSACFLPSMPDDPRQRIARDYMQKPGYVYLGTCNHVYLVPPCGLPMNIESCGVDGCAVQVGGTGHIPLPGHVLLMVPGNPPNTRGFPVTARDVTELTDQTPKAYCPLTLLENATWRVRDCASATAFWLLRFLVDATLLLSTLANFGGRSKADALALAAADMGNTVNEYYYDERLGQSWKQLSSLVAANQEDALLLVHWTLDALASTAPLAGDYSRLDTLAKRQEWERWALAATSGLADAGLAVAKLRELKVRLQQEATPEQKQVLEAVTETVDSDLAQGHNDGAYRANNRPALWRMRTTVTVDDFKRRFVADAQALAECPKMALLVTEEEKLRCIASLPDILAWKTAVEQHFNKRIDKQTAETRTVGQILQELSPEQRREWGALFHRFAAGWNLAREFVQKHHGEDITLIEMNERVPLVYSLNTLVGEGAQGVALVKWLIKKHNDVVVRMHRVLAEAADAADAALDAQAADEAYRAKMRRFGEIPLHLVRTTHMLQPFPAHGSITRVLQLSAHRSYAYGKGQHTVYDYARVEEFLFGECVHGRPLINADPTQLRMVSFLNEAGVNGLLKQIEAAVSPQRELSEEVQRRIKQELNSPELAQRCLRACEMCLNFLRTSGGDPRQSLVEYAHEVLLINCHDEASGLHFGFLGDRRGDAVCLAHVNALWRLLHKLVYPDQFSALAAKYREKLPAKLQPRFSRYCMSLKPGTRALLADTLEAFVRDNLLEEETRRPDAGAKEEFIGKLLTNNDWRAAMDMAPLDLPELLEFTDSMPHFPNDLKLKHCFDAFRVARQLAVKA